MHSSLRKPVAALMLLLPAAGAFVAAPATAQPRAMVAHATIHDFSVQPQGRLVPGRELRFRLEGVPGGRASLDIPGVVKNVALRETRRGVYEGRYTVRRQDRLAAFDDTVATLRVGHLRASARIELPDARAHRRDTQAPRITQLTPSDGARVGERGRTFINARLADAGSGVDPRSVRLVVNGLDVTRNAHVTQDTVAYREELGRGRHDAELLVRDRAGNLNRVAWTFRVV